MARAWWTTLAVVAALAIGVAGCGSSGSGTAVRRIALVAPYGSNEPQWTSRALGAVAGYRSQLAIRVDTIDASRTTDIRGLLEQASHAGNQLVIAHDSRYADVAEAVAADTKVPELVWGERPHAKKGLVGQITVQDKEGGYMAGVVAATSAITRRLAVIVLAEGSDWDTATWNRTAGGYVAGARSVDPGEQIRYVEVGQSSPTTPEALYAVTHRLLKAGSQFVLVLGGSATVGALRAIEDFRGENQYVGVIGDKAEVNKENIVLASILYDFKPAFREAVVDVRRGRFGQRPYALTLVDGGISVMTTGRTPGEATTAAEAAKTKLEEGQIRVPVTSTAEAVQALIAQRAQG
ncbi:MAG TPA: BMP family ABC transporter substrate-binding protein [Conexibacter sp.]|nr:BMP family ABC transporter substrate-binding protein [Conexibacter sp.]